MARFNTLRFAIKTDAGFKYVQCRPPPILKDRAITLRKATGAPYFTMSVAGVT